MGVALSIMSVVKVKEAERFFQEADGFELGSTVQVGDPPRYGVVRWLGYFPGGEELLAGIELDDWYFNCGDGLFEKKRYFSCQFGHALFEPLKNVKLDERNLMNRDLEDYEWEQVKVVSRRSKDDVINGREQEIGSLREEIATLQQNLEKKQVQRLELELITTQQLAAKDEQIEHLKLRTQQLEYEKQQIDYQNQQLEQQKQQTESEARRQSQHYEQQITDLQRRLEVAEIKISQSTFTKVQIPQQDEDSWNVRRQEVTWHNKLGNGAWGSVFRGAFRGQRVAVKRAHEEILHQTTIDQLKREIRIMIHARHPNLVRLLAAVVDKSAEECKDSPLLVLELLDTDLRSAYTKKIVNFEKNQLISIFRDVACALYYLHEHQEPIIHRDVSAPNVLLQKIAPGVWKAKLSDFGSANLAKHCKTSAPGAIVYAAPETFPPSDPRSPLPKQTTKIDVFSYGYLLVEAVAKKMPSPDNRSTMLEDIERDWRQLYDIVIACIEYKPDNRLTMTQVLEKLNMLS